MSHELTEGRLVRAFAWPGEAKPDCNNLFTPGRAVISMEQGEMGMVPYVLIRPAHPQGHSTLVPCLHLAEIGLYCKGAEKAVEERLHSDPTQGE